MILRLLLLWLLIVPSAHAQDERSVVAVVPLDGAPGTSSRDMVVVVRGLTEALRADGRVDVVSGAELVERLTEGKAASLQEARDAFAEGQLLLKEGDPDIGLAFLSEAVAAHGRAGSPVVRREEMADAAFILAKALIEIDDTDGARNALTQALRLLPDYLDTQTEALDPALRSLALEVEKELASRPPRRLSATGAQALADDIQVDRIVHGIVRADGSLTLVVYGEGNAIHTETRPGPFRARRLEDPWYPSLALPLGDAALGLEPRITEPVEPDPPMERPDPPPVDPIPKPPEPPDEPKKGKGGKVALGIAAVLIVGGAAAGGTLYALERRGPPQDAWELEVVLGR